MEGLSWPEDYLHVAGRVPRKLEVRKYWGKGDRRGLACLVAEEPEVFVFSGHGLLHGDGDLGLQLEDGVLTHYEIPSHMRLPRNKLTLLAACVTGQGANLNGGEVSGFLRAFMAAGAGVLGVSLWSVRSDRMAEAIRSLLAAAAPLGKVPPYKTERGVLGETKTFNAVTALHAYYKEKLLGPESESLDVQDRLEASPLVLYL